MSGPLTRFGIDSESREQRQEKILAGVIATVYRQVPQSVLGSIVLGFALVAVFWNTHNQNVLVAWFTAMLIESLVRLRIARAFAKSTDAFARVHTWASWWVALAASAGVLWGAAGVLFFSPQEPTQQLVLVAVILGVAFGSLTLYATHRPALFFFLPLALLPLVGRMIAEQDPAYYTASIVMLAVFGFASFFGRNFGEAMFESVKNNYENEVLVGQLMNEKRVADDARRDAENATRSKTQFFAAASHDLRQPLQAIGIYVSLLRKRVQGPAEPLVANLSSAVESLSKLVEELLEISRLDSGAIQPRVQQVLLDDMFKALEQEFTPMAANKGLELRVRRGGAAIESDPLLLLRVLRNLLANAIKYTQKGGVLLAARPRGGVMSLEVWDTGAGIKQQELDRVFEEFYRGESGKSEGGGGGFGLGLSIVKRICGVLGHPLIVTTRPGSGTVFRVEAQLSSQPRRRARAPEPVETVLRALTGYTVVVLEDNEEILNSMTRLLRSWGADIISSISFNASLVKKLSLQPKIDVILADQNLGNSTISGVEAAFRIRELVGFPVPVVMLTAVQQLEVLAEFQRQMRDRLSKNPDQAAAIARSRVEEPIVLQKPTTTVVLNRTIADALGIAQPDTGAQRIPTEQVLEGSEERLR
ncbi:MAG: hybrid sensor histidine kinase/response regulator [Burkholderiaceae bacterium]|nr:hybrid sensor histidine kinase/response regulator [Burkholderiaceae bacterium]